LTRHNYVDINLFCQSRAGARKSQRCSCRAIRWSVDEYELEPKANDAASSSYGSDFNYDCHVSFTKAKLAQGKIYYNYATIEDEKYLSDELSGFSVFYKDENGEVFHTYSSYARGGDLLLGAYNFLDLTPKGRNEREIMDWVRRNDEYASRAAQSECHRQTRTSAA